MNDPHDFDGLKFFCDGYFVYTDYPIDLGRKIDSFKSPWELWIAILARARVGNFSWVPFLLDMYLSVEDYVLKAQCVELLADAAPATTVSLIRQAISSKLVHDDDYDPQFAVDMSRVLFSQKRLADVPLLFKTYRDGVQFEDTEIILTYMEYILGEVELEGGTGNLEADSEAVSRRYGLLLEKFGTGEISLWLGEPFTILGFIKMWQKTYNIPDPLTLRSIFEATTGVDCRRFFNNEEFQPLLAAAILEEFIESGRAESYKQGVRYFFGNQIHD